MRVLDLCRFAAVSMGVLFLTTFTWAQTPQTPESVRGSIRVVRQTSIQDVQINESSGLAASRRFAKNVWTHNDSGDTARVFLLDENGATRQIISLSNAQAVDWEDIAIAGNARNAQVYVGDIGDNERKRASIQVYRFAESQVRISQVRTSQVRTSPVRTTQVCTSSTRETQNIVAQKKTLRYPDGAHDAETLIATARGEIIIVAKEVGVCRIYKTAKPFADNTTQTLVLVGRFQFAGDNLFARLPTGGDLNAREDRVLVRTYADVYEWKLPRANGIIDWRKVWKTAPQRFALPPTRQGEAICYNADSSQFVVSSEGENAPLQWLEKVKS